MAFESAFARSSSATPSRPKTSNPAPGGKSSCGRTTSRSPPATSIRPRSIRFARSSSKRGGRFWRWASPKSSRRWSSRRSGISTRCFSRRTTRPATCRTRSTCATRPRRRCRIAKDRRAGPPHARRRLGNRQRRLGLQVEPRAVEASRAAHAHHGRHDPRAGRQPEPARQILLRRLDVSQRDDQLQAPARVPPGRRHHHRRRGQPRLADGHAARVLFEDGLRPREVQAGVLSRTPSRASTWSCTWNRAANGWRWAGPASSGRR